MGAPSQAPTREATLTLLLRQGEIDAAGLASQLGISVQAMRRHLRTLEDEGLVESTAVTAGPGRPSNLWRLTSRGHQHFPDGSETFAIGLLDSLAQSLPPEMLSALLQQQAQDKADQYRRHLGDAPLEERVRALVDLRGREGYVSDMAPAQDGRGWCISEFHCSVQRIAEEFPAICDQELQLIRMTFPDCQVERVHWRLESGHSCGFQISPTDNLHETKTPL
ncbi:MAG: iron-sulfur cluster biosynthesis transcriptional regulator SufR [Synechococcus sp.]|jgi:DeoR family suf operon transcriptional repressor|uniref:iron-sulfur cluster biosynthesis transcriptional regulator SufR n=1 Tax=Synechococcus sp. BMK-MC-1 TaxID=1442551 RepID=UPI0016451D56|nr:iron-sulfur cluster biosynthesis transcriptional regulator SufR [Synechococcus sp. BMK-MC-1]QNI68774.1 iron-sulfur cluster biosynthesis transcriptional regulator SufR [Synechococcus sp. BMK-MC-1]